MGAPAGNDAMSGPRSESDEESVTATPKDAERAPPVRGRVTGVGGIFFKTKDPKATARWYADHLGLPVEDWGGVAFKWRDEGKRAGDGATVWSPFPAETTYFAPGEASYMVNLRVDDLDAILARLRARGVRVMDRVEESEFGRFGWFLDPDGAKVELWQPPGPSATA
jgi:catechol 2,3-dioxygenase-like lactoylglutathione lyase family enzyme